MCFSYPTQTQQDKYDITNQNFGKIEFSKAFWDFLHPTQYFCSENRLIEKQSSIHFEISR